MDEAILKIQSFSSKEALATFLVEELLVAKDKLTDPVQESMDIIRENGQYHDEHINSWLAFYLSGRPGPYPGIVWLIDPV